MNATPCAAPCAPSPRWRPARVGGCVEVRVDRRNDGTTLVRATEPLGSYPARLTDCLAHWAVHAPERCFVARRGHDGNWRAISYREMQGRARALGQALLDRGLSLERPLLILSGNDLEHLSLALGAMWAGIPHVPVSTAYSLVAQDFSRLRAIVDAVTPGMVFASDPAYARAIAAVVPSGTPVVLCTGGLDDRPVQGFDDLLATTPGPALDAAHAATHSETIAKVLFTSGSTRAPKGVVTTHRMLCANQQMLRQCLAFLADEPPVLVDWLPWNHVFGGNHNVGIALYNGGTLYIDDGKPTPAGIAETLRNLREISPTVYFNVPKGLEEIAAAMDHDSVLRESLFRRCRAIMFAGAGLSQAVWDRLDAHAERTIGERVRIITGLGMTETAPACTFAVATDLRAGRIGLPAPGVEVKLAPVGGKTEIRFRGPNLMPAYWRAPAASLQAFDEEGFYRTGDAVRWVDEADPQRGLQFDGRLAEDFKLATGTFVSVGPLRAKIVLEGHPCVQDAVITGLDRDEVGALIFPRVDECRRLAALGTDVPVRRVLDHPRVRGFFQALAESLWASATGSASRPARLHLLAEPPSIDRGELTDKGSINQRAVLDHRAALVDALHARAATDPFVIVPRALAAAAAGATAVPPSTPKQEPHR